MFTSRLLPLLLLLSGATISSCSNSNGPSNSATGTVQFYVITNVGGPAVGPLAGAPIRIEPANGNAMTTVVSDTTGHAHATLNPGTYVIQPLEVPARPDFYHPPQPNSISIVANSTVFDTIYYTNPIVSPGLHSSAK